MSDADVPSLAQTRIAPMKDSQKRLKAPAMGQTDMTLNPNALPSANFDLSEWKLQLPVDADGGFVGRYTEIKKLEGYTGTWFNTGSDGAMVLRAPVEGVTTGGARYARSELRELNPDFAAPTNAAWTLQQGGSMAVAMQVDEVPTKFDGSAAKVVIGQIHGGDHQLVRLYWENGSIYWVNGRNEAQTKDVTYLFKDAQGNTPKISLNETFVYTMDVKGHDLRLTLTADGITYTSSITIGPGWDDNQFYFKAGLYLGTNEETSRGEGQVSIYGVDVRHDGQVTDLGISTGPAPGGTGSTPVEPPAPTPTPTPTPAPIRVLTGTDRGDVFTVSEAGTAVSGGKGFDTVKSSVSFTLAVDTEKLELTGTQAINGTGSANHDQIMGNTAANTLLGQDGDDKLFGRAGADQLEGGYGADWLDGGSGDDRLLGGVGNDVLTGAGGRDSLTGGEGSDTFVFLSAYDSRTSGADRITDFTSGTDRIDLSAVDANSTLAGDQAFAWGGAGQGHLVLANGVLSADLNGDGRFDFSIDLGGAKALVTDFLL